ncbi:DUF5318 family protein [Actinomadura sp. KC345]|uniref:DUF5318 family protein n=1 Tax=Actinomadura sp. KC345 TaxID=2530371 RepID=UPI001404FE33|nr:DUF5318 family protein [Actinomadura sp. KC345]
MYRLDTSTRYVARLLLASGDLFRRPGTALSLLVCAARADRETEARWSTTARRAAPAGKPCTACRHEPLTHVTYVYGDEPGRYAGRVEAAAEPAGMGCEYGEFRVYVVEVCQSCAWNHLAMSCVLGHGAQGPER